MNLTQKTLAIVSIAVLGLIATLYGVTRFGLLGKFSAIEQTEIRNSVERSKNTLFDDVSELASTTNDYGAWDRTYTFMQSPSGDFPQQEFKNPSLQGLGINLVVLMDPAGRVLFSKYYDLAKRKEKERSKIERAIASSAWVRKAGATSTPASGLLMLPQGPVLIAACPILTSERTGPARGTLVMARDLDQGFVSSLSAELRLSLMVRLASDPQLPADFQVERPDLVFKPNAISVRPLSNDIVAGYSALNDVDGDPLLLLRVDGHRDIYRQGVSALNYFLGTMCLLTLAFGVGTVVLLRYMVLGRLIRLNIEIGEIGERRDLSMRVSSAGNDEISRLGSTVNTMLDALQNGDSQFREISENIRQVFWVKDEQTQEIAYISPPWESPAGISREHLFAGSSKLWLASVYPEDREIVDQMLKQQQEGIKGEAEYRIIDPSGTAWWTWCRYFPVFDDAGQLTQTVGLSEDLTEYKNTEEVLHRSQDDLWNAMFAASAHSFKAASAS